MKEIEWNKQHCGVHQAPIKVVRELMPDLNELLDTFPDRAEDFTWDIKVHMLMPRHYPCIPNWHYDNVPRPNGVQDFSLIKPHLPMYLWISGPPITQFEDGYIAPKTWIKFNQQTLHRGTMSSDFCWRGFIRATHVEIQAPKDGNHLRKHCQVYIDSAETYKW